MSLVLIGMRGAGKSSVGALAASRLGLVFLDSDRLIEEHAGLRVEEIFAKHGEPFFRTLERQVLLEILPRPGSLIATGGGCVMNAALRAAIRAHSLVLWLAAPAAVLAARIKGSPRPSLTGADLGTELPALLRAREPLYRACADKIIETDGKSLEEVADVIQHLWQNHPRHHLR